MQDLLPLDYGAAEAQAPSALAVRPVLLFVGILHGLAAAAGVAPVLVVWSAKINLGRWWYVYPPAYDALILAVAVFATSLLFAAVCARALVRPDGAAARRLAIVTMAYLGVWLADGLGTTAMTILRESIPRYRGPAPAWQVVVPEIGAALCREAGQTSLLLLILYAFRPPDRPAEPVARALPWAVAVVCALQVLQRGFLTAEGFARRYHRLPPGQRLASFLQEESVTTLWTVGAGYLLVCLLALVTFRRSPRLAGVLAALPFLLAEPLARGALWTAFDVSSPLERALTVASEIGVLVFSATTPIAAFVLFTLLGRRLPPRQLPAA